MEFIPEQYKQNVQDFIDGKIEVGKLSYRIKQLFGDNIQKSCLIDAFTEAKTRKLEDKETPKEAKTEIKQNRIQYFLINGVDL